MNAALHQRILDCITRCEAPDAALVLDIYRFQAEAVPVYRHYNLLRGIDPLQVNSLRGVPFLPVSFFKTHAVIADGAEQQLVFTSSGTTGQVTSQHRVADVSLYEHSFRAAFRLFYGPITDYVVLALLPSYLERGGSSLVYMAEHLIRDSGHAESGFYLHDYAGLAATLRRLHDAGKKILLLGVTYALLDLAEQFPQELPELIIMETGGMKGKRREMIREELHEILKRAFHVPAIHSEYGMTELFSQAYSKGDGTFFCPPWMQVLVRDANDPFTYLPQGRTGGVNLVDCANLYSCSFIEVADLGRLHADGGFEILGRFDHSDMRGCNLLIG